MPAPVDQLAVGIDRIWQLPQRSCIQSASTSQTDGRRHPELGFTLRASHMDVHGLARIAFVGVEEESEVFVSEHDVRGGFTSKRYELRS